MKRYEIWKAELPVIPTSHVQQGYRPIVIVSNDSANQNSPIITPIPLTSQIKKRELRTHVLLRGDGLQCDSLALCEQILTLDKTCLKQRIGRISHKTDRSALACALAVQLGIAA